MDSIQDIIERMEQARDRCANASDEPGVSAAEQALADFQRLDSSALPTALDIEDYFHELIERIIGKKRRRADDDSSDDSGDDSDDS